MNSSILAGILATILSLFGLQHPNTYADPAHRFSFDVPSNETVQDIPTASGVYETLLIRGGAGDAQIVITPWSGAATIANLETEFPYLQEYSNQGVPITETTFENSPAISLLNQLWFSHGGYLYVTEDVPPIVLSSWRF